jgi:hypothetical protein
MPNRKKGKAGQPEESFICNCPYCREHVHPSNVTFHCPKCKKVFVILPEQVGEKK